jgi:hypothetical protein
MTKIHCLLCLFISYLAICSLFCQDVLPNQIEYIKINHLFMPNNFQMVQEQETKPGSNSNERVYRFFRRNFEKEVLELTEENTKLFTNPSSASSFQKWYRVNETGRKDKIEIGIIICATEVDKENTIRHFTIEAYSVQFYNPVVPILGDKSWISTYQNPIQADCSLMFIKSNVFVRVFVSLENKNNDEIRQIAELLAQRIENNIKLYSSELLNSLEE